MPMTRRRLFASIIRSGRGFFAYDAAPILDIAAVTGSPRHAYQWPPLPVSQLFAESL